MAVDTHIFRVSNRTGLAPGKNVLEVEKGLVKVIPPKYMMNAHHWLLLHGRYVCKAKNFQCENCLINDLCGYPDKTTGSKVKPCCHIQSLSKIFIFRDDVAPAGHDFREHCLAWSSIQLFRHNRKSFEADQAGGSGAAPF